MAENQLLAGQFEDIRQQEEAATLGMWTFLATEVIFFGGLIVAYVVYRTTYPRAFEAGSQKGNLLLGTTNTAILLTSSLTMALAVAMGQARNQKGRRTGLFATLLLGLTFLSIKAVEYGQHFNEHLVPGPQFHPGLPRGAEMFFLLYFTMTGLHAVHLMVGCGVIAALAWRSRRTSSSPSSSNALEVAGLYWHFVDLVWVFLYPMFYLVHL